uniref:Chorein_N domain-containing protein n=1 Tax=Meloidogyne hapla TaxID=6305 RepID=A0A1I8AWE9_MELHA
MTSLIKNQIVKHLSTFARNLKPEQISLEVLRGKGQLRNLELNEEVISERLEFPPWLKIVKAHCSSVTVKIPWTQIKSSPVQLVVIRLVTPNSPNISKKAGTSHNKSYDLPERVLECLSLYVQSIEIYFETESDSKINFGGSIMLSHLILESRMHNWQDWNGQTPKINMTRIHDKTIGQVLFFKHVSWRVLKIEASHNNNNNNLNEKQTRRGSALNSPLRLLTENGRCRITIKKNTSDCSLIAGRMELLFDEIHWLAYMAHLRSAIDFYEHIMDLANSASNILPKQLNVQQFVDQQKNANPFVSHLSSNINAFRHLDITQSSHHLLISRIDLHLCDDSSAEDLPPDWNIDSGAMQATIHKLRVDFYPQHKVFVSDGKQLNCSPRSNWLRYLAPNTFTDLANRQLDHHFGLINSKMDSNTRLRFERIWPQLISANVVIRVEDLIIQAISERNTKKDDIRYLIAVNKSLKDRMPQPLSFAHLEITSYSFPATDSYPVPPNSVHLMLAPFELIPDIKSVRWLIYAFENILNSFEAPHSRNDISDNKQVEIRIEMIMPKIMLNPNNLTLTPTLIKNKEEESTKEDKTTIFNKNSLIFPKRFFIHLTTVLFSNYTLLSDTDINFQLKFPQVLKSKAQCNSTLNFIKFVEKLCFKNKEENNEEYLMLKTILRRIEESKTIKNLICDNKEEEWYFSVPTLWVDCDFGPNTWELALINDLNMFGSICSVNDKEGKIKGNCIQIEPRSNIDVILDHFQYVQIEKLGDRITDLLDQINAVLPTGLTPSPYDMNYNFDLFTPLDVYTSSSETSSHAINYETSNSPIIPQNNKLLIYPQQMPSKSNSLVNVDYSLNEKQPQTSKQLNQQYPNSARASLTSTVETLGSCGKSNFKTVSSLPRCDILNEGKMPFAINELQTDKKQKLINLMGQSPSSDFYGMSTTTGDLESNFDETLSITSISTEQLAFDSALNDRESEMYDDEEVAEAEEAIEDFIEDLNKQKNNIQILRHKEKFLGREVNIFDLFIEDLNLYLNSNNGNTNAFGFAKSLFFDERLRVKCEKIYNERKESNSTIDLNLSPNKLNNEIEEVEDSINPMDNAKLKIELNSFGSESLLKLNINGINIQLNKEIISQLGPFFENQEDLDNESAKAAIELILQNCNIEIKEPKKRFPIRIRLGEVFIEKSNSDIVEHNFG